MEIRERAVAPCVEADPEGGRGARHGARGGPGNRAGASGARGTGPGRHSPCCHLTYCFSPCWGTGGGCGGAGARRCQGAGAAGESGAPVPWSTSCTRAAWPQVSERGSGNVQREREHFPVSSSAVPLAPALGDGLRGSGEGSWDGHPATLKQSEQKRWDETGGLVHEMKPLSPAGSTTRPPHTSLLAPMEPGHSGSSCGEQNCSGTAAAGKPPPPATLPLHVPGGKQRPVAVSRSQSAGRAPP